MLNVCFCFICVRPPLHRLRDKQQVVYMTGNNHCNLLEPLSLCLRRVSLFFNSRATENCINILWVKETTAGRRKNTKRVEAEPEKLKHFDRKDKTVIVYVFFLFGLVLMGFLHRKKIIKYFFIL